jgi:hypothetical protein
MYNQFTLHCIAWNEGAPLLQEVRAAAGKLGILNPKEVQADGLDERCQHGLALSKDGHAIGCMRITPEGCIERMAVLPQEDKKEIEAALMEMLNDYSREYRSKINRITKTRNESQTSRLAA